MKYSIKLILLLILLMSKSYAQLTTTIDQVFVNSQTTVMNCNTIDFGTTQSNSLAFYYTLNKGSSQAVGDGTVTIYLKNSSSSIPTLKISQSIPSSFWSPTQYQSIIPCNVGENEVQVTGSSIYIEYDNGSKYKSCEYPIIKTPPPTFSLSPNSVSIPCGDTSSRTFTVTSTNIPSGATLTYLWSNTGGWSGSTSTTSSITLNPSSGVNLPGTVYVTPVLNGVTKPTMTCTVTRASFSSTANITGTQNICTGSATYSISGILAGQTVSWSLSNTAIATITSFSNTSATVTFNGNGAQTLTATITNACNQTTTKPFLINTGSTTFTSAAAIAGSASFCSGSNVYTISGVLAGQTVTWSLSDPTIATLSGSTNMQTTVNVTGSGSQTLTALITNSCNQTAPKTFQIYGGVPTLSSFTCGIGATFCSGTVCLCDSCLPSLDPSSLLTANMSGLTSTEAGLASNWQWLKLNNNIQITTNKQKCYIAGTTLGATGIQVRARNSCGWSQWYTLNFNVVSCNRMAAVVSNSYTISPNPAKDIVTIELTNPKNQTEKAVTISGELFDMLGNLKSKVEILKNKSTFSVAGLIKGIYVLKIHINNQEETHQIAVE